MSTTLQPLPHEPSGTVLANESALRAVSLRCVEDSFALLKKEFVRLRTERLSAISFSLGHMEDVLGHCERQMRAEAFDAVQLAGRKAEVAKGVTVTPPGEGLQPGEVVPGKGIFIGDFNLVDACGKELGVLTRWYDAAHEFSSRMTFEDAADALCDNNTNGRGGLRLNPARYEVELFEMLKSREAIGKHVMAPLAVVQEIFKLRNSGEYKRMSVENSPGKLTTGSRAGKTTWQWSCTSSRNYTGYVRAVDFAEGSDVRDDRDIDRYYRDNYRFSVRACFAELVP